LLRDDGADRRGRAFCGLRGCGKRVPCRV